MDSSNLNLQRMKGWSNLSLKMKDWSNLNLGMMIQNTFYTNKPACTLEDIFPVAQCDIGVCLSWNTVVVEYFDTVETPVDGEPADNCWLQEH